MCITLAAAGIIAGLAGSAVSVMGSINAGKAAQQQAEYQSQVQANNAKIAEWNAEDANKRGAAEEAAHRKAVSRMIGAQRAGMAGSGFEIGDGTNQDILGDTAAMGELDALTIRSNAAREAWGYRVQRDSLTAESQNSLIKGSNAKIASYWQAGGDLLSGASKFATGWSDYKKLA